ncbi:MAG TPA: NapC/NirT family cytochrome c [Pseudolabrys sp.]|nr:NapC/NirT family cytochrome c [Pseudolabrys sp.]
MKRMRWWLLLFVLIVGGFLGAGAVVGSVFAYRDTSTDAFCTSCHSMQFVANDPLFIHSKHHSNAIGVQPSCGDCHIRRANWFLETYDHVTSGVRDVVAEYTHNYSDPQVWGRRRIELAHEVRATMRKQDSVTCRSCHDAASIQPASERGQAAHALMREGRMTCIDCHFNLVHAPVPPSMAFIRGSGIGGAAKK